MVVEQLAVVTATSFASAAAYINLVEQPARLSLKPEALLSQWKTSYKRGTIMQVSLAVVAACLGFVSFAETQDWRWLAGALALLALLPYTFIAVMPTNRKLMSQSPALRMEMIHSSVRKWGNLHAGRTALGIAAVAAFLWASV